MDYSLSKLVPHQSMIIISQLYFGLKWFNDSNFHWIREAEFGWSKSSLQCDLEYFLCAIVEGLNDEVQWPIVDGRAELGSLYPDSFCGSIGVGDVKQFQVVTFQDPVKERQSFSRGQWGGISSNFFGNGSFWYIFICQDNDNML